MGLSTQLNMPTAAPPAGQSPAPMNVFARFLGIITSPRSTFESVVAHPKVLGMVLLVCALSALALGVFFSTPTGQDAWVDAATNSSFGGQMNDQQFEAMQKMAKFAGPLAIGQAIVGTPILMLIVSGILFAIFNALAGGNATFKQLFAVVAHSWPVLVVSQLFTLPVSYMRGTLASATSVGVLLPMLDENSFAGRLLGMIDLFWIWALVALAIGLAVLYRRKTQPIALSLLGVYAVIIIVIAAVRSS